MAEDDITIDFGKLWNKIKGFFSSGRRSSSSENSDMPGLKSNSSSPEDISFDFGVIKQFVLKYKTVLVFLLIMLLQFVPNSNFFPCVGKLHCPWGATWTSLQGASLPPTLDWARNAVNDFYRNQVVDQINQQYPNLPDDRKKQLVDDNLDEIMSSQKDLIAQQTDQITNQFKSHFEYTEDGKTYTYMPDIDPYNYIRLARNYLDKGILGDRIKDGKQWDDHVIAPRGSTTDPHDLHPYVIAYFHKIVSLFRKVPLMESANYLPVVLMFLSFIPAYFLASRYGGWIGGFFAVAMLGLHPAVIGRTLWGHADTDAYNILFPMLISFLFLAGFHEKEKSKQWAFAGICGFVIGLYSIAWGGWWYIFDFILATFGVYAIIRILYALGLFSSWRAFLSDMRWLVGILALVLLIGLFVEKFVVAGVAIIALIVLAVVYQVIKGSKLSGILVDSRLKNAVLYGIVLVVVSAIFVSLFQGRVSGFLDAPFAPFGFTMIKEASASNLWPNVYTTVAELNPISLKDVVRQFGNYLLLLSLIGIGLCLFMRDEHNHREAGYSIFLAIWFFAAMYATTKGVRFVMMMVPPFAIAFGISAGLLVKVIGDFCLKNFGIKKWITTLIIFVLFALSMSSTVGSSYGLSRNDVPIMNDAWYNTLVEIRESSMANAIITSWWDYGHHFKYVADRPVTFDGAWQNTPMAHWVGKLFLTEDEEESIGILRMLDCGGNQAFEKVNEVINFTPASIKIINSLTVSNKEEAARILKASLFNDSQIKEVLGFTHCEPPEAFVIASNDMIGKGGVWAHFGSWNFERADLWVNVKKLPKDDAIAYMKERYNYSDDIARQRYAEVNSIASESDANSWIAPWPSFSGGSSSCSFRNGSRVECGNGIFLEGDKAFVPTNQGPGLVKSVSYINREGKVVSKEYPEGIIDAGIAILPKEDGNLQAILANIPVHKSIFVRLFFGQAHGLKYYKFFKVEKELNGQPIYTYKVDWEGKNTTLLSDFVPHSVIENGARVRLNYIGWTEPDKTVFDSTIKDSNVTPSSDFVNGSPVDFVYGKAGFIDGFSKGIAGMKESDERTIEVLAEQGYGLDPSQHPLANKTLYFRVRVEKVR
ncbi:FKBP-type peptidyl-prolyl cis-trans isomerase [Candidatus Woesearchaeota archaeon]|nr:FKBP-type peptidyl-prolyl cis-trans isomerase [Candidatus Woesearchaeota archaeon]